MSPSDAAPLPRQGEVFFDVRGSARSMRLSWYADTGVAVFSIWQAGTCTGTFRLPMADLPRMIATLSAGPPSQQDAAHRAAAGYPASDAGYPPGHRAYPGGAYPGDSSGYPASDTGYAASAAYPAANPAGPPGDASYPADDAGYPEPDYHRGPVAARPGGHWDSRDRQYPPAARQDSYPEPGPRAPFTGERSRSFAQDYVRALPGSHAGTFTGLLAPDFRAEPMSAFAAEAGPAQSGRAGGSGAGAGRAGPAPAQGPAAAVYPVHNADAVLEPGERPGESLRYGAPAAYQGHPGGR